MLRFQCKLNVGFTDLNLNYSKKEKPLKIINLIDFRLYIINKINLGLPMLSYAYLYAILLENKSKYIKVFKLVLSSCND